MDEVEQVRLRYLSMVADLRQQWWECSRQGQGNSDFAHLLWGLRSMLEQQARSIQLAQRERGLLWLEKECSTHIRGALQELTPEWAEGKALWWWWFNKKEAAFYRLTRQVASRKRRAISERSLDKQDLLRHAARERAQVMVSTGEMLLPPDYAEQAAQEVERLREGAKKIKTLKKWRSPVLKATYDEQVLVFGSLVLIQVQEAWMLFERSGKVLWHKYHHKDLFSLYEVVIHLSFLCDWTKFEELPLPERLGVEWKLTDLTWSTGQSMSWELFSMMAYDLTRAAEAANAISRSPL